MLTNAILLIDNQQFIDIKNNLDKVANYPHDHSGEPERFPCLVVSEWYDNPNGPYSYRHNFVYVEDIAPLVSYYVAKQFEEEVLDEP